MKDKNRKPKMWFKEHKDEIAHGMMQFGWTLFIFGFGYCAGIKILESNVDKGIAIAHDRGLIKFFDPTTHMEVDLKDVPGLIKKVGK